MNKKKLGSIVAILFVSAVAATSSTLAWFASVRNATITYGEAVIYSDDGDLTIGFKNSLNTLTTNEQTGNKLTLGGEHAVTDISGNGLYFYKPVWADQSDDDSVNWIASSINPVSLEVVEDVAEHPADGYFVDFTITVSRNAESNGIKVFLGENTVISPKDINSDLDKGIVKATRMAVINYSDGAYETGTPNLVFIHAPEAETNFTYIIEESGNAIGIYQVPDYSFETDVDVISTEFDTASLIEDAEEMYPAIADLMTSASQDITFRLWVEGTDEHALDDYEGGAFNVDLDIYALAI